MPRPASGNVTPRTDHGPFAEKKCRHALGLTQFQLLRVRMNAGIVARSRQAPSSKVAAEKRTADCTVPRANEDCFLGSGADVTDSAFEDLSALGEHVCPRAQCACVKSCRPARRPACVHGSEREEHTHRPPMVSREPLRKPFHTGGGKLNSEAEGPSRSR